MLSKELQVYKDTFELSDYLLNVMKLMPRTVKYTLGQRMFDVSVGLFRHIINANRYMDKREMELEAFVADFEEISVMVRLCDKEHVISVKQMSRIVTLMNVIGKQVNGWKSHTRNVGNQGFRQ